MKYKFFFFLVSFFIYYDIQFSFLVKNLILLCFCLSFVYFNLTFSILVSMLE